MDPMTMAAMSDPELAQMLSQLGSIPDEQKMLMTRLGIGNEQRSAPMAKGMEVGHTYVASSPLEHLANALERRRGGRQMQAARAGWEDTLGRQNQARSAFADAMTRYFGSLNRTSPTPEQPLAMPQEIGPEVPPLLARPTW